jgi:hypothetical protein
LDRSKRQHSGNARRDTFRHQLRPSGLTIGLRQIRRPNAAARSLRGSQALDMDLERGRKMRKTTGNTRQTKEMSEIRQLHTAS